MYYYDNRHLYRQYKYIQRNNNIPYYVINNRTAAASNKRERYRRNLRNKHNSNIQHTA